MIIDNNSPQFTTVITGMGIYCPIGENIPAFKQALMHGTDGIKRIKRFSTKQLSAHFAAMFNMEDLYKLEVKYPDLDHRIAMAVESAKEAYMMAKLEKYLPERIGIVLGICLGKMSEDDIFSDTMMKSVTAPIELLSKLQYQTKLIAEKIKIKGPVFAISTACASSNHAIGFALDLLRFGFLDAVLVGGTSEVTLNMFAGFYALGNMSNSPCAPFSVPVGLNLGEGAGFLILERMEVTKAQTFPIIGSISGFGSSSDAYHPTSPDPNGWGVERAISTCLKDAGLQPEDIGYINMHGTGTQDNDQAEWLGIKKTFGEYSKKIPVSSSKSFMGHTGAAAGIIETIITIICMNEKVLPTTLHFTKPRRLIPDNIVFDTKPRSQIYKNAINCNSGFGGSNAAVIISKNIVSSWEVDRVINIDIAGSGSVSAYGINNLGEVLLGNSPQFSTLHSSSNEKLKCAYYVPKIDFSAFTNGKDERYLDPVSRYMITASAMAIKDSNIAIEKDFSERTGIVTAVSNIPSQSLLDFRNSIKSRSILGNSSHAFSKIVMNAAMGAVCEIHSIKGPSITIAASEEAGLFAAAYACINLVHNPDLNYMMAIAADELGEIPLSLHSILKRPYRPAEGAGCVIFGRKNHKNSKPPVQVTGLSIAAADQLSLAIKNTLNDNVTNDINVIFCSNDGNVNNIEIQNKVIRDLWGKSYYNLVLFNPALYMGYSEASTAIFSLILAIQVLRKGEIEVLNQDRKIIKKSVNKILVNAVNTINGSCAMLIERSTSL